MREQTVERWGISANGPPLDPAEVESARAAVEVVVMWGDDVLHVQHVSSLGDVRLDRTIGEVGADHPILVERDGRLLVVVPDGAEGTLTEGGETKTLARVGEDGELRPFDGLAGASACLLPTGARASAGSCEGGWRRTRSGTHVRNSLA